MHLIMVCMMLTDLPALDICSYAPGAQKGEKKSWGVVVSMLTGR